MYYNFLMLNEKIVVKCEKLLSGGNSLCRVNGFPLFVEGGCPGDLLEIVVTKVNKNYGFAKIEKIVEPSNSRTIPFCKYFGLCGGCSLQHVSYDEQLVQKRLIVEETLKKTTGENIPVNPVIASPRTENFRHKVQYPVAFRDGKIIAGYFKKGSHEVVDIDECPVQVKTADNLMSEIKLLCEDLKISAYDEHTGGGLLRHVIFRVSKKTKEVLVIFVINETSVPEKIKKLAAAIFEKPDVVGVCVNFNNKKTNVIEGEITKTLCGQGFYTDELNGVEYKVSSGSFFQVNPYSAQIIFETARRMISDKLNNPSVLDAYSGVSAFGLQMKDIAREIVCVEECKSASFDAAENVKLSGAKNVKIINSDAFATFEDFAKNNITFDVVLLDPPRKGCGIAALEHVVKLAEKLIVYVSCNPATLAADINFLHSKGFKTRYVQPVDMFCHTPHVECVALIERI